MAGSNERGRALEYKIAIEAADFLEGLGLEVKSSDSTKRLNFHHKDYFDELDSETKDSFEAGAKAFCKWLEKQEWVKNAMVVTIDRFGDDKAKKRDPTDIQLGVTDKDGQLSFKNFSVKHRHNALCHPRLPSLAQQCGFTGGSAEDKSWRKTYNKVWNNFYGRVNQLNSDIKTTTYLKEKHPDFILKNFLEPMQKAVVKFLKQYKNKSGQAKSFFRYLVGDLGYYVIKNKPNLVEIKHFENIGDPKSFSITYPAPGKLKEELTNSFLIEFSNGWQIAMRLHTASSRLLKKNGKVHMSEKEDPICQNLEQVITIESVKK